MFDMLTIAAVADELTTTIAGGRIQRIGLIDPLTVAAEIYANGRRQALLASATPQDARVHLTASLPSLDPALTPPLLLLLRKYVRNGVLIGVDQPPLERILRLSIAKRLDRHNERDDDHRPESPLENDADEAEMLGEDEEVELTYVHLVIEVMGRHSNIILTDDDGWIMESAKRVTPAMSRVRTVLPHQPYLPPPPRDLPDPRQLTAESAAQLLATASPDADLANLLVRGLRGFSPQMAREIAFRVAGTVDVAISALPTDATMALAREIRALMESLTTGRWEPCIYREDDDEDSPVAGYSAVPMRHLADEFVETRLESISRAVDLAVGEQTVSPRRHTQRRERLARLIAAEHERVEHRLIALRQQLAKGEEAERLREAGELIYGWLWQIQPGQETLDVDGATIRLDPTLSPKENAQAYFERYRKAKGATAQVPQLIAQTEAELTYLDQLRTLIDQAETFNDLEALAAEWERFGARSQRPEQNGKHGKPKRLKAPRRPAPLYDRNGNAISIGRTGEQNDLVTFDVAGPEDTWLHARGVPGSHVVVRWRAPGQEDEATIAAAAALAAYYSAARGSGTVEVDVTQRRYVRKIKGGGPGLVTYRNERTIPVQPRREDALPQLATATSRIG